VASGSEHHIVLLHTRQDYALLFIRNDFYTLPVMSIHVNPTSE
jgi:hypothetical protein